MFSKGLSLLISLPLAWIFFRARSIADGWYIATHLFVGAATLNLLCDRSERWRDGRHPEWRVCAGFCQCLGSCDGGMVSWEHSFRKTVRLQEQPIWFRWSMYYALILSNQPFILNAHDDVGFVYFQF